MPEGDTVWRAAHNLDRALTGLEVTADLRVPDLATRRLGGTVLETVARGKHLLTRFDSGDTLHTHLKMEGSWHLYRAGERWRRPTHEARVVLTSPTWTAVGFSLGTTEVVRTAAEDTVVGHLGPDLLGPDWDPAEAVRRLAHEPDRPLGEAILDQRNLTGIGNVFANEICFLVGRHPHAPVGSTDLDRLVTRSHAVLGANRDRTQRSTTGDLRRGRDLWVYGRTRQPCRRCGTRIEAGEIGSGVTARAGWWCPRCQPPPT